MYEIFTIGGGRFLFNFFSAVAAMTSTTEFQFAIIAAMLASFLWLAFVVAFNPGTMKPLTNWAAACVLIIGGLLTPTFTVKITDRINRIDSSGYIVANVPAGLALFASLTSTAGDLLTREFETNFSDVDAPTLHENGFLFGVRLLSETTRMEISDDFFAQTMSSFVRQCLFYDILLGRKSIKGLTEADDPWTYMTNDPAVARMFEIKAASGTGWTSSLETCKDGVARLNTLWNTETNTAIRHLATRVAPTSDNIADSALQALIQTELSSMHNFLIGASRNATEVLQRQMTINAILNEPEDWLAETGDNAALDSYINARLDLQTEQSYRAIARQAEKWVPNLKAVFQCIYYGIFPFALLLMLSPMGTTVVRNYIFGLVWIESWGPLYAIINYIVNSQASERMRAVVTSQDVNGNDITIVSQAGIQAVEAHISVMAGYLSMSIPFLAIALAAGAGRFAALATSTLAVSQEAVADTTRESATGNLSVGNTSYDSHQYHNRTGNQWRDSAFVDTGSSGAVDPSTGAHFFNYGSGYGPGSDERNATKAGSGLSEGGTSINYAGITRNVLTEQAANSRRATLDHANSFQEGVSEVYNDIESLSNAVGTRDFSSLQFNESDEARFGRDFTTINNAAQSLSEQTGRSVEESRQAIISASAGGGFDVGVFKIGGEIKALGQLTDNERDFFERAQRIGQEERVSEAVSSVASAARVQTAGTTSEESENYLDQITQQISENRTSLESFNASRSETARLEQLASKSEESSETINQNLNHLFYENLVEKYGKQEADNLFTRQDQATFSRVRDEAEQFVSEVVEQNSDFLSQITHPDTLHSQGLGTVEQAEQASAPLPDAPNVPNVNVGSALAAAALRFNTQSNTANSEINEGEGDVNDATNATTVTVDEKIPSDEPVAPPGMKPQTPPIWGNK